MAKKLFIQVTRDNLPQVKERYPFIYLEHGRLEVDDSSIKWIDADCNVVHIPVATILTILLGPGTSVTHEAMKVMGSANCTVCWVGDDSLLFFSQGKSPTADSRLLRRQAELSSIPEKAIVVARRMFSYRFPKEDVSDKSLQDLMGMEGLRVRALYEAKALKYKVGWSGRDYVPGKFEFSDIANKILTATNTALYSLLLSTVHALGYSPYLGFVHSGSPLPFIYDLADLYKEYVTIDLTFSLTKELAGFYDRAVVADAFRERILQFHLMEKVPDDIDNLFNGLENARRRSK